MEFLNRTLEQIKTQLGMLTRSQRLVIILLLVIAVGAIWWMTQYAAEREMTPLLNQSFSEKERARIIEKLETWDEKYGTKGDQILVPKVRHSSIVSRLALAEALPEDISMGFSTLFDDVDIFTPQSAQESKEKIVLQSVLARTIAAWPGIRKVDVFINKAGDRRLNNITPVASASVSVQTDSSKPLSRKTASAIAALVSAANARMKRENVQVIANGQIVPVLSPEDEIFGGDYLEQKIQYQNTLREQILNALGVPNALVVVDAKPRITKTDKLTTAYEEEKSWLAKTDESNREQSSSNQTQQAEPGIIANVADTSTTPAGSAQSESLEEGERSNTPFAGSVVTKEITNAGGVESLTATVRIPLSYFVSLAQREAATNQEPSNEAIAAICERELPLIKQAAMHAIGLKSPDDDDRLVVNQYWDGAVAANLMIPESQDTLASSPFSVKNIANNYGKHIVLTALAMISFVMVFMMVRKATAHAAVDRKDVATMLVGEKPMDAVGVEEGGIFDSEDHTGLLAGMEINENSVRSRQVLEQIRNMVKESPENAAALVNKWMTQDS